LDKKTEAKGTGLFNESVTTPVIVVWAFRWKLRRTIIKAIEVENLIDFGLRKI
jgi:hypothetical protein